MIILLTYILLISIITFTLMFIDKQKAIRNDFRIPESTLISLSLIGGGLGTYIGMRMFRHKTLHKKFYIGLPIIIAFNFLSFSIIYSFISK